MLLALLTLACTTRPPDLLLVTWDTTRDDHVTARVAPNAAALAAEGVRFTEARTTAPLTLPAHASLLTGLPPLAHGVRENGAALADEQRTLAERLSEAGYRCAAFVSAAVLFPEHGLTQGFETYSFGELLDQGEVNYPERRAGQTVAEARAWLAQAGDGPVFLWVHLFDPHRPWEAPEVEGLTPYEAELRAADTATAALVADFQARGRAVVALTADHGEGMGEHGEWTHGYFAYDSTMRVPLILAGGPFTGGRQVPGAVSLTDLAPALASLAGLGDESVLVDAAGGAPVPARALPMEATASWSDYGAEPTFAWVEGGESWHWSPRPERYDLGADPGQRADLFTEADRARGEAALARWSWSWPPEPLDVDAQTRARLEALGYLGGAEATAVDRDPKDRADLMSLCQAVAYDRLPHEALAMLDDFESRWGRVPPLIELRVHLLDTLGRGDEAAAQLRAGGQEARAEAREAKRAEQLALLPRIEAALERDPDHPHAYEDLGRTLWGLGRLEEAEAALTEAARRAPEDEALRGDLAKLYVSLGRPEEAVPLLQGCARAHLLTALERPDEAALEACAASGGLLTPRERAALGR